MSYPIFPPEIEEIIFVDALEPKSDGRGLLNLLLVAKRIHGWLLAKLFTTVAIRADKLTRRRYPFPWHINALERYGVHTQHLFIWTSSENDKNDEDLQPVQCLSFCPNVTNLVLWTDSDLNQAEVELMSHLPLTHLSINRRMGQLPGDAPVLTRLFSRMTHLEDLGGFTRSCDLEMFKYLTSLTHLAIPDTGNAGVAMLFGNIPTLQVLVFSIGGEAIGIANWVSGATSLDVDDPRVVRVTFRHDSQVEEWLLDVQEGRGMWGLADEAVRKRKLRQVGWGT
ncbi:hypothetical protein BDN72DRAFT_608223 [Pluteus cervinus]|uniref:Uncharacterized protein n=1 Tax=Pluteus cervinus TaxID=181527 RepID=A0ACD3AW62_9AGAR|nr:hypothetical protein BDN72DRAFT_608223 [Pluteus cervinus]